MCKTDADNAAGCECHVAVEAPHGWDAVRVGQVVLGCLA